MTAPSSAPAPRSVRADPAAVLHDVFGYADFRDRQREVVEHVLGGGDALVLMPTGGGKSLCYQVPALCLEGTAVVISPLIALQRDQVQALRDKGVRAAYLNSSLDSEESRSVFREMMNGRLDLLYVAPERALLPGFLGALDRIRVSLFAIDEAHVVSSWGGTAFRPEYAQLGVLKERYPEVPRIALTATADPRTREEIIRHLGLEGAAVFSSSFDRPNISLAIDLKDNPRRQLLSLLARHRGQSGIVYCLSRNKTDETAAWLDREGIAALPYHAGLPQAVRQQNQERFLAEPGLIMAATVAFGMGIDKPDIRFVAHLDLPSSIDAYMQEIGRCGRDGGPAEAWMTYGMGDVALRRRMIDEGEAPAEVKRVEQAKLGALLGLCETARCRRQVLLSYFGETLAAPCGNCDTCRTEVRTWDATEAARKAMSAIYRTGQSFGVGHLVDVLTGKATDKVKNFRHDQLPTFGVGDDLEPARWQSVFRQLLAGGHVLVDHATHGGLRLGETARAILRGEVPVMMRLDPTPAEKPPKAKPNATAAQAAEHLDPVGQRVWQRLRAVRRELAGDKPPYVVFADATLLVMARERPSTLAELGRIPGVGPVKLEKYGAAFVRAIDEAGR
jgi:ATP-dependent DNA helicase RecQ